MNIRTSKLLLALALPSIAVIGGLQAGPPSAADVGDAETFGHAALYMGAASGFVTLSNGPCPSPTPTPSPPSTANNSQCFEIDPTPASITTFDAQDICRIKLPKKATRNVIYPAINIFLNYQLQNNTGVFQSSGFLRFSAIVSIESDALLDPTVIDPATGDPAAGKLLSEFTYIYRDDRSMDVNARQRLREDLVRVGNTGITKAQLVAQGIPASVVDAMFAGPMTIRMSISGSAKLLTDASITGNMRLFGD